MAVVGRLQLNHPALATLGGSSLHDSIESLWTEVSDSINSRFFTEVNLANSASVDFSHNFNVSFDDLSTLLYEYNDTTGEMIGQLSTGFVVEAKAGDEKQSITVTNNSGSTKTIALIVVFGGGSGGGGGGGSLVWNEPAGDSPLPGEEFSERVYFYESGLTNKLVAYVRVPDSYVLGKPVVMNIGYYSPGTSGTQIFTATSTLVRPGTDAIDSTTNQHTSTNTGTTAGAANLLQTDTIDLSSSDGKVNSVDIAPGHILKVELARAADTDTQDLRFMPNATEVLFA